MNYITYSVVVPMSIIWAGAFIFLWKTDLGLLKIAAIMMMMMNVAWIITVFYAR